MEYNFYFKDEEPEAQRDSDICPRSVLEELLVGSKWQS